MTQNDRQRAILCSFADTGTKMLGDIPAITYRGRVTRAGAQAFNSLLKQGYIQVGGVIGPHGAVYHLTAAGRQQLSAFE